MKLSAALLCVVVIVCFGDKLYCQNTESIKLPAYDSEIYTFAVRNDTLYYVADNKIIEYDLHKNQINRELEIEIESDVISIQVLPRNGYIFLGEKSGSLSAFDLKTGKMITNVDHQSGAINTISISDNKNTLVCGCENGIVYTHSASDISQFSELYQHKGPVTSIAISDTLDLMAISGADGKVSLFKGHDLQWIKDIKVGKNWIRNVGFNEEKRKMICVGDDGRLREYLISNTGNIKLLYKDRVSANWLLSLHVGAKGKVLCWGGLDHFVKVRTQFGIYNKKMDGPVIKIEFIDSEPFGELVVCCILREGIQIIPLKKMEYKTLNY